MGLLLVASLHDTAPSRPSDGLAVGSVDWAAPGAEYSRPVPEAVAYRPGRVRVSLEGEDGRAVAGASVRAFWLFEERAYLAAAAVSNAEGLASLEALALGELWLVADATERQRASTRVVLSEQALERDVALRLGKANALSLVAVGDDGAALGGAVVLVKTADPLPFRGEADAQGRVVLGRLGPPPWQVEVQVPGYETTTQWVAAPAEEPTRVTLRRLGVIEAVAVETDGRPVGGALVTVVGTGLWPARQVRTDDRGRARITQLSHGLYELRATHGSLVTAAPSSVTLGRGAQQSTTLVLSPGRMVRVRVVEAETSPPKPIASVRLVLSEGGLSAFPLTGVTDVSGEASLGPVGPEDSYLTAQKEGFVASAGVAVPRGSSEVAVMSLSRGVALRGEVVDDRGFPIGGASIEVVGVTDAGDPIDESPARSAWRTTHFTGLLAAGDSLVHVGELGVTKGKVAPISHAGALAAPGVRGANAPPAPVDPWVSRADGSFRAWPLPRGLVRALVRHPAYLMAMSDPVRLGGAEEASVRVALATGGILEGRVRDDRDMPVSGARVVLLAGDAKVQRTTFSASDGSFTFTAVPGEADLGVMPKEERSDSPSNWGSGASASSVGGLSFGRFEGALATQVHVKTRAHERKHVDLVMPKERGPVTVHVRDERGDPLVGVRVSLRSLSSAQARPFALVTNRDGLIRIGDAQGLSLHMEATRKGSAPVERTISDAPSDIELVLGPGLALEGSITTRGGRLPLAAAEIVLRSKAFVTKARSDKRGAFHLEDAPAGPVTLSVHHPGYVSEERELVLVPPAGQNRPVVLDPVNLEEGGSLKGEVVDRHGDPVVGARVSCVRVAGGARPAPGVTTGSQGAFALEDLPEGDYSLSARALDGTMGKVEGVRVRAGQGATEVSITVEGRASAKEGAGDP